MARDDQDTAVADVTKTPVNPVTNDCLVVIYAEDRAVMGRRYLLNSGVARIGRMPDNEISLGDEAVSRRHARIERGRDGWLLMDVGSRNGTLLNETELVGQAQLRRDDRIRIGSTIFKYLSGVDVESLFHEEIYQLSIVDHLTGLHNRRFFDDSLEREFSRARRYRRALTLMMVDIDWFKRVNDQHGHPVGDFVLQEVGAVLKKTLGRDGALARYGGEEFALVLPETHLARALRLAEDLRATVAAARFEHPSASVAVTVSVGVATLTGAERSASELWRRADEKLYAAKHGGRNRVCS
ncbi:MAG TPA: GGDEF domain-containing protein [Polyangiaceae bacterium]|nr:GGDEF domain-containing protein [Polyangiaceae bacterium]